MFTSNSTLLSKDITTIITDSFVVIGGVFNKNLTQLIKSLFSNNEVGFAYDPNDLTTLYQDAAGTIPVTAAGQPVGLVLDKGKGLVVGSERLVNGDFSNGSANWNVSGADATHIVTFADGKVRYQSDTVSPVLALYQGLSLVTGKWYEITVNCSRYISGSLKVDGLNGAVVVADKIGITKSKLLASNSTFSIVRNVANTDITLDSISVKELAGNHAYQTTSAARPILRQNAVTGANYLEFDGTDDFLVTNSIDFTVTDEVSLFAGVRKLSDASRAIIIELSTLGAGNDGAFGLEAPRLLTPVSAYSFGVKGIGASASIASAPISSYQAPNSAVITAKASISDSMNALKVNNTSFLASTSLGTGNFTNYPLYIGRRGGTSLPFNGHIYSLIGVGKLTSDDETVAIEKEIAKQLGVP